MYTRSRFLVFRPSVRCAAGAGHFLKAPEWPCGQNQQSLDCTKVPDFTSNAGIDTGLELRFDDLVPSWPGLKHAPRYHLWPLPCLVGLKTSFCTRGLILFSLCFALCLHYYSHLVFNIGAGRLFINLRSLLSLSVMGALQPQTLWKM